MGIEEISISLSGGKQMYLCQTNPSLIYFKQFFSTYVLRDSCSTLIIIRECISPPPTMYTNLQHSKNYNTKIETIRKKC